MTINNTLIPIYTATVGAGGQGSIEFNDIPQTYTDLILRISGRNTSSGGIVNISFNSDTTAANYEGRYIESNGSAVGSYSDQDRSVGYISVSSYTNSTFGNSEVLISNYTSSAYKCWSADGISENNATAAYSGLIQSIWKSTAAITSITLTPNAGTFAEHSTATLYGIKSFVGDTGEKAIGGVVTSDSNYWYHTFTTSGNFTPTQSVFCEYILIAGGAGGGTGNGGGGGGAGGLLYSSGTLSQTNYLVSIGAGGARETDGNNTTFNSLTALRGGRGGNSGNSGIGSSGFYGSGGGSGRDANASTGGAGTSGQGFAGGGPAIGTNNNGGGGGGGAGGTGFPGKEDNSANDGGLGGIGSSSYSLWGSATSTGENVSGTYYYAGGGGGAPVTGNALGGNGGGGRSATYSLSGLQATSGSTSTGGGGGGGGNTGLWSSNAGAGGSGIVIIRYAK